MCDRLLLPHHATKPKRSGNLTMPLQVSSWFVATITLSS